MMMDIIIIIIIINIIRVQALWKHAANHSNMQYSVLITYMEWWQQKIITNSRTAVSHPEQNTIICVKIVLVKTTTIQQI